MEKRGEALVGFDHEEDEIKNVKGIRRCKKKW